MLEFLPHQTSNFILIYSFSNIY